MTAKAVKPLTKILDTAGVCSIIESCAKFNVSLLKWGDLEISFTTKGEEQPPSLVPVVETVAPPTQIPDAEISDQQRKNAEESLVEEELRMREAQISELQITDPLAAEQLIRDGDLDDVDDEPERDE